MKFRTAATLIAATAIAAPTATNAWTMGPNSIFFPPGLMVDSPRVVFGDCASPTNSPCGPRARRTFRRPSFQQSPRYQMVDDEHIFRLAVDVPGVKMEDISVSLEDSNVLTVSGRRDTTMGQPQDQMQRGMYSQSRFSQSFALDPTVDIDKFSASLENGVLVVTAPKDLKRIESNIRKIPINSVSVPTGSGDVKVDAPSELNNGGVKTDTSTADDTAKADKPTAESDGEDDKNKSDDSDDKSA